MDKTIIKSAYNKTVGLEKESTVVPIGVEYEKLVRDLRHRTEEKYERKDLRNNQVDNMLDLIEEENKVDNLDKKTVLPVPGMLIDQETNMFSPYPQSSQIPYTNGPAWSDY